MSSIRLISADSDTNQKYLDQIALSVFCDMGIITVEQYNSVKGDVQKQIDLLYSIEDLQGKQAEDFSERFVDKICSVDERWFDLVPYATLAKAYKKTKERLESENLDEEQHRYFQERYSKLANRIDDLIDNFSTRIGYYFVDNKNIADVYAGLNEMFDVREPDIEETSYLHSQIRSNRAVLEEYISAYDSVWGISNVTEDKDEPKSLSDGYDIASKTADTYRPSEETLDVASRYKFLDENGEVIPQFKDGSGNYSVEHQTGYSLDENGRLANVINLARHDYVLHHINDAEGVKHQTKEELQSELDNGVLHKLFEIDTAEKIADGIMENPDQFTNPEHFNNFINNLNANGGSVSETGYQAAMDAQVNKTAGFAGRIKQKLGKFGNKATGLFVKIFKPIQNIDKRKKDRFEDKKNLAPEELRQRRIDFFVRMLKGVGNAMLVSGAIMAIATAGAMLSGVSIAVSIAAVGVTYAIARSAFQIHKWRKAQRDLGRDDSVHALLRDKRMMTMLGVTSIASIAMIFGAAGLTAAAVTLGYGALTVGGGANALFTFNDAKAAGMSTAESVSWALANAAAVIAGAVAGRAIVNSLVDSYNESHHHWGKTGEHEETETEYNPDAVQNAEKICKMWYKDNPDLLQQRVDLINNYNTEHGTHIDPYRAIMINGDAGGATADNMLLHVQGGPDVHSHGHHTVMTARWAAEHGFSMDEVNAVRHMFDDMQISGEEAAGVQRLDPNVSVKNEVGYMTGRPEFTDHVLPDNTVDAHGNPIYTTYANGDSPFVVKTNVIEDFGWLNESVEPVGAAGMFGTYTNMHDVKLKDRAGSLADRTAYKSEPDPEPVIIDPVPDPDPVIIDPIPEPDPEPVIIDPIPEPDPEPDPVVEPKWLRITHGQAKGLDDLEHDIAVTERQLANPKLSVSKRRKLDTELRKWKDKLNKLKNEVGDPDNDTLWSAQYWAFRKQDLEVARARLEKVKQRKFDGNSTKYEKPEVEAEIAKLEAKIAEYEAEIPDESLFYDPIPVQYDKKLKRKIERFSKAKQNILLLQQKKLQEETVGQATGNLGTNFR